jgi:alkylation response protein AidB-like acyl-CoA dehydrogenase
MLINQLSKEEPVNAVAERLAPRYSLSEEHEALRASVRAFADRVVRPRAAEVDRTGDYPWDVHESLKRNDLLATHVPEAYGGAGADAIATAIVIEELSRADASTGLVVAVNELGTTGLLLSGSDELKSRYLPKVATGEWTFSYALSEREAGSDAAAMRTHAVLDGDSWVLDGIKGWISQAGVSTHYMVMAATEPGRGPAGISAFVVHADDEGLSVGPPEKKLGVRGSPTCEVVLDACRIPADRIVGRPGTGFATALATLDHTRLTVAAQAVGIAQGSVDAAVEHTLGRRQFGKAVAEFQGVQLLLADMAMRTDASRQLVYAAAAKADSGAPDLTFASAAAKCFASDAAMQTAVDTVQLFGGAGYTSDFPVERYMRDAKITQIYEGTNQMQRVVTARHLLR